MALRAKNEIVKAILGGLDFFGWFWGVIDGSKGQK